uniref:F-box/LRR-repeat protein 15/At3g58940/PEG3-like LRR domain-containing protein n=1 Tax=Setaria italica TaxID=4555 RepID=K4A2Y9_SETIT
ILVRLRCAGAAARTSVLSRRWRGLWRHLPELSFRGVAPGAVEAALAQVALPKLSLLDIDTSWLYTLRADAVASLFRTAARLDPVELSMMLRVHPGDELVPFVVPSFARAKSIRLDVDMLHLTPPALDGGFPALERLSITNSRFDTGADRFDIGALISRCPQLRVLELINRWGLDTVTINSATIEELLVMDVQFSISGVDIVAPVLKKFTFSTCFPSSPNAVGIDGIGMWCLGHLKLGTEENGFVLGLNLERAHSVTDMRNLQEMFQLPNISALELCVGTRGHVYGAMALNLLRICNATQRLKLFVRPVFWRTNDEACAFDCPCNQPQNWRSQNISLTSLEELEIENFEGSDHEVDFLKLLFRCAPLVNVTLKLASKVVPSNRGCKETYNIFKDNPAVKCHVHVYRKRGKEVIYA